MLPHVLRFLMGRGSYIKKCLAVVPMQLGSYDSYTHVFLRHTHIFLRRLTLEPSYACKVYGHAVSLMPARRADIRLYYNADPVDHS
jgi:lysyl-tRNA synthetase class I